MSIVLYSLLVTGALGFLIGDLKDPCNNQYKAVSCGSRLNPLNIKKPRVYYNIRTARCESFRLRTNECAGKGNRFSDLRTCNEECVDSCRCFLDKDTGGMVGVWRNRFFYNLETRQCEQFKYRGRDQHGRQNNFLDKESCETRCSDRRVKRMERLCGAQGQEEGETESVTARTIGFRAKKN